MNNPDASAKPRCRQAVPQDDVLAAARELRGLARMDQIRYAVLESSGTITIIAKSEPT